MFFNSSALTFQQWLVVSAILGVVVGLLVMMVWTRRSLRHTREYYRRMINDQRQLLHSSSQDYQQLDGRYNSLQQELMSTLEEKAILQGRLSQLEIQQHTLESTKANLTAEFERLSNKIFEDKHQLFQASSQRNIDNTINPLKEKIGEFKQQIETFYIQESSDRNQLIGKINELQSQTTKIGEDAMNLANALKGDNKVQGAWGEVVLQRVLESSGLQKGREYDTQLAYKDENNKTRNPDVVIYLPDDKQLIIDAKMSLTHYEQSVAATDTVDIQIALKAHVNSIRSHIKLLSDKNYEALKGINGLDFVFIFVPIDAAFIASLQHDAELFQYAFDHNIVLVSPSTLMATLRTVSNIWRFHKQHQNAEEIARQAGGLYDQFVLVIESLDELDHNLSKAKSSFDRAKMRLHSGKGNVLGRVEKLRTLGAKTKKRLPLALVEGDEAKAESTTSETILKQ